jgi:hypothetical protein
MHETNSASRSLISIGAPIGQSQRPHRNDLLLRESLFFFILVDNEPSWRKIAAKVFFMKGAISTHASGSGKRLDRGFQNGGQIVSA